MPQNLKTAVMNRLMEIARQRNGTTTLHNSYKRVYQAYFGEGGSNEEFWASVADYLARLTMDRLLRILQAEDFSSEKQGEEIKMGCVMEELKGYLDGGQIPNGKKLLEHLEVLYHEAFQASDSRDFVMRAMGFWTAFILTLQTVS